MNYYDEVLKVFCVDEDDPRGIMKQPSLFEGCVYATNGFVLIEVPKTSLKESYEVVDNFPRALPVLDKERPVKWKTTFEDLSLKGFPMVDKREETKSDCLVCRTTGMDSCPECGQDVECEECEGTGKVISETGKVIGKVRDDSYFIVLCGLHFQLEVYEPLLKAVYVNKPDNIYLSTKSDIAGMLCEFDGVRVVIMPFRTGNVENLKTFEVPAEKVG